MTRKPKKTKEDEIDWDYEPKTYKQFYYILLVSGLIIFCGGLYMTLTNSYSKGITQSRFGGSGHEVTLTGPVTLFLSALFLIPWLVWTIKKMVKKDKK